MAAQRSKVLLIGWDAADWKVINPLLEQGKMPNLARLIERGVMGSLATLQPVLSPMLWTSIATGKRPFKHGILGFSEPTPDGHSVQPVSQLSRTTKALWNIFNQEGYRSTVVGWWPSHPVEPINGVMVSNHYQQALGPPDQPWPMARGTVHPARLQQTLAELRFNPNALVAEEVLPFVPRAAEIDQDKDQRLSSVMKILAECVSVHNAATWLLAHEPWDFFAVYYDAIDHFCHGFMRYHPPRQDWISERDFELYRGVVEAGYRFHDLMLGTLLGLVGDDTWVLICSDHGFHPDHLRPREIPHEPAGPAIEHRDLGILVMAGPGLKRDELIHGASLLDITPTILTL
jgi:predicted AlkP superfamily phosphohydrolase/phosphomutase